MKSLRTVLNLLSIWFILAALLCGCGRALDNVPDGQTASSEYDWRNLRKTSEMQLDYAQQFAVDDYEGGYRLVTIAGEDRFLLVPKEKTVPKKLDNDITVIKTPVSGIYLPASSAMDLFRQLGALDLVTMTGIQSTEWSLPEVVRRMEDGEMLYCGKYSAPDYELLLANNCELAIESTMIYHKPEVKEQLERVGIPVLIEHSSYENEPMGRVEWIRLYGLLTGKERQADAFMRESKEKLEEVLAHSEENTGRRVVFFYINGKGNACVHRPDDYISKMMELAGGSNIIRDDSEHGKLSTVNMQMEAFYEQAVDADILIYNSIIDGNLTSIGELLSKNELLKDFKAVKEGNVWCTEKNLFQETTGMPDMIKDFYEVFSGAAEDRDELTYLHRLKP